MPLGTAMRDFDGSRPNGWKTGGSLVKTMLDGEHQLPNTCSQEVVGVFGYGKIGSSPSTSTPCLPVYVYLVGWLPALLGQTPTCLPTCLPCGIVAPPSAPP